MPGATSSLARGHNSAGTRESGCHSRICAATPRGAAVREPCVTRKRTRIAREIEAGTPPIPGDSGPDAIGIPDDRPRARGETDRGTAIECFVTSNIKRQEHHRLDDRGRLCVTRDRPVRNCHLRTRSNDGADPDDADDVHTVGMPTAERSRPIGRGPPCNHCPTGLYSRAGSGPQPGFRGDPVGSVTMELGRKSPDWNHFAAGRRNYARRCPRERVVISAARQAHGPTEPAYSRGHGDAGRRRLWRTCAGMAGLHGPSLLLADHSWALDLRSSTADPARSDILWDECEVHALDWGDEVPVSGVCGCGDGQGTRSPVRAIALPDTLEVEMDVRSLQGSAV